MKSVTAAYTAEEEAIQRKPVELYHIWRDGGEDWYYTSGDVSVVYNGQTYVPAVIKRDSVSYNSKLEAQTMKVSVSYLEDATLEFISINPVEILWLSCVKLHRDQSPLEASVVFVGQIQTVLFKGVSATISCVGFEFFLKRNIPIWRYQKTCNHMVFDTGCALTKVDYAVSTTVTLDSTGLIISSSAFGAKADGYFTGGEVIFGEESRTIVLHEGNDCTLIYKFLNDVDGGSVSAYPGCDGRAETCRDTFSNIDNFFGFPFIPTENPALRVDW